jgi:hypothetical protein
MLSNILLSRRRPYIDQTVCICQILEEKWKCNETVLQLFVDFKKAYNLVRKELLYKYSHPLWGTHEISGDNIDTIKEKNTNFN